MASNMKFTKILVITIATTLVLLSLKNLSYNNIITNTNNKNNNNINISNTRKLINQDDYKSVCIKGNITLGYAESFTGISNTLAGYIANLTSPKESFKPVIENVFAGDKSRTQELVIDFLAPYIIIIVFAILTFISYFFYIGCCCKPCFCCKGTGNETGFSFKKISLILVIVSCAIITILSIIGYVFANEFAPTFDSLECSLMRFYTEIKYGQDLPNADGTRWIGFGEIKIKMDQIENAVDEIVANANNGIGDTSWEEPANEQWQPAINSTCTNYASTTVPNPNPLDSNNNPSVIPGYISTFQPLSQVGTSCYNINLEFNSRVSGSVDFLNTLNNNAKAISSQASSIKSVFRDISTTLGTVDTQFTNIEVDYITPMRDFKSDTFSSVTTGFNVLFGLLLLFSILFTVFLVLMLFCNLYSFRFVLHILWNLITLITIIIFIIAAVFGLVGFVSLYLGVFVEVILSPDNSNQIFGEGQTGQILDTCLNGNGKLETVLIGDNNDINSIFGTFYTAAANLKNVTNQVNLGSGSIAIENTLQYHNNLVNDITVIPGTDSNTPSVVVSTLNTYTDLNAVNSQQPSCNANTFDRWVGEQSKCPNGYTYASNASAPGTGNAICLVITEWNSNGVTARYATSPTQCTFSDYNDAASAASAYITSLNSFQSETSTVIGNINSELNSLNDQFVSVSQNLNQNLQRASGLIDPLTNILGEEVGDDFFSIFNCQFMSTNIGLVINVFSKEVHPVAEKIGVMLAVISCFFALMLFFGIIVLLKHITGQKNKTKTQEGTAMEKLHDN